MQHTLTNLCLETTNKNDQQTLKLLVTSTLFHQLARTSCFDNPIA